MGNVIEDSFTTSKRTKNRQVTDTTFSFFLRKNLIREIFDNSHLFLGPLTVKRVDEVVRHPHLVTQDQNTQVSNKFYYKYRTFSTFFTSDRTSSLWLHRLLFANVELLRQSLNFSKAACTASARTCYLHIHNPVLYHCATLSSLFKSTLKDRKGAELV